VSGKFPEKVNAERVVSESTVVDAFVRVRIAFTRM